MQAIDTISALLLKGIVIVKYPLANLEHRKKQVENKRVDYYIVWPFKSKNSLQPLSHGYTELEAWERAAKRINNQA